MTQLSLAHLLEYDFIRNAFIAGTIVAITAGIVGYFVVLRGLSFAGHALSHVGFAGATGAVALGVPAVFGLLAFALLGAAGMGALGERARGRDVAIGIVLAWSLGLGVLFLSLYKGYATEAYSLLFGEILGISALNVAVTAIVSGLALAALAFLYRPLLFSSVDPDAALARGVPVRAISTAFMVVLALTVATAAQVVGVLLIFALLVTPAAIAERLTAKPVRAIALAVVFGLAFTWGGLLLALYVQYPVSFFITSLAFAAYVIVRTLRPPVGSARALEPRNVDAGVRNSSIGRLTL
jgi:zinc/manganese transport system permease protein